MDNLIMGFIMLSGAALILLWQKLRGDDIEGQPAAGETIPASVPAQVTKWETHARQFAKKYDLPVEVVLAQIWQESGGDPEARGSAGEIGLMQLKEIAIKDLKQANYTGLDGWDRVPSQNIKAGAAFLDLQRKRAGNIYSSIKSVRATGLESYNEGYAGAKKDTGLDEYAEQVMAKAKALGYAV